MATPAAFGAERSSAAAAPLATASAAPAKSPMMRRMFSPENCYSAIVLAAAPIMPVGRLSGIIPGLIY